MNTENTPDQGNPDLIAQDFIERMGLSTEADGLPRIAGRMWGFFIIHGGPSSFAELAEKLQVSRGSISTNARILRDLGIIERTSLPGDRQDYYQLASEPYTRMLEGYVQRMRRTAHLAASTGNQLAGAWPQTQTRLDDMHDFYTAAVDTTEQLISTMRNNQAGTK